MDTEKENSNAFRNDFLNSIQAIGLKPNAKAKLGYELWKMVELPGLRLFCTHPTLA